MLALGQIKLPAFLIITLLQVACSNPKAGILSCKYCVMSLPMPHGAYWQLFYNKSDPNIIFLSEKNEMGPGIMLDLKTGTRKYLESADPNPGNIRFTPQLPGETEDAWRKRTGFPAPIVGDDFGGFGNMESSKSYYTTQYSGKSIKRTGLAPEGFPFPKGLRQTEEYFFTGDLVISVRGEEILRQHLEDFPSTSMRKRAWEALQVGLVVYRDEHLDGTGTVHILKLKPVGKENQGVSPVEGVVGGVVGPVRPSAAKELK